MFGKFTRLSNSACGEIGKHCRLSNQMKKCKAYKTFEKDFHKLYGTNLVVYGPYKRKQDGRRIVVIYDGTRRITKLYAKVKLEIKIGRILSKDETVDHIDKNPFNDKFSNLRMLSREKNARRSALNNKNCLGFKQSEEQKRNGEKKWNGFDDEFAGTQV